MTRLGRARALANEGTETFRALTTEEMREFVMDECGHFTDTCHCKELAASLLLDGYPAPPTRRKLPWVRNVYPGSGLPF